jgi:hypothetical protein
MSRLTTSAPKVLYENIDASFVCFSSNGRTLAFGGPGGKLRIVTDFHRRNDIPAGTTLPEIEVPAYVGLSYLQAHFIFMDTQLFVRTPHGFVTINAFTGRIVLNRSHCLDRFSTSTTKCTTSNSTVLSDGRIHLKVSNNKNFMVQFTPSESLIPCESLANVCCLDFPPGVNMLGMVGWEIKTGQLPDRCVIVANGAGNVFYITRDTYARLLSKAEMPQPSTWIISADDSGKRILMLQPFRVDDEKKDQESREGADKTKSVVHGEPQPIWFILTGESSSKHRLRASQPRVVSGAISFDGSVVALITIDELDYIRSLEIIDIRHLAGLNDDE